VNATAVVFGFGAIFGLMYLASTTAFNNIIAVCTLFLNVTYAFPQGLLLWRGRDVLPPRWLNLGRWGIFINAFSVIWICFMTVIWCFPSFAEVEVSNMSISL
jgi:choline transport protein